MKILDGFAAAHVARDDVGGLNGIDLPGERPRIIGRCLPGPNRMRQSILLQNALNSRQAGQGSNVQFLQTSLNRLRPNQAVTGGGRRRRHQHVAHLHDRARHRVG